MFARRLLFPTRFVVSNEVNGARCPNTGGARLSGCRSKATDSRSVTASIRVISSSAASLSSSSSEKDEGFFGMAGGYIKNFRWSAAEEMASKLSEEERRRMSEKTKQEQSETDKEGNKKASLGGRNQPSVEELVAEAKAKEAQRVTERYEEEWGKREAEVERAVRKRLESDLELQRRQIAFEKWKEDLEREKQRHQAEESNANEDRSSTVTTSSAAEALGEHPILGPVVCDMGHKRVHLSTTERLASLPVWEKQRFFRHERAKSMAKDKAKSLHIGLPGVIGIYESQDGSLSILDGQHRIGMLKILSEKKDTMDHFDFDRILVEVYSQPDDIDPNAYANEIFQEINKAQPANLVDLPGVVNAEDLEIINTAVASISDQFADMFKPSTSCRRPHLNIDNLRNELFLNKIIVRHGIKTAKEMEEWILARNQFMAKKYQTEVEAKAKISDRALEKAQTYHFYLGLDATWYDE